MFFEDLVARINELLMVWKEFAFTDDLVLGCQRLLVDAVALLNLSP